MIKTYIRCEGGENSEGKHIPGKLIWYGELPTIPRINDDLYITAIADGTSTERVTRIEWNIDRLDFYVTLFVQADYTNVFIDLESIQI